MALNPAKGVKNIRKRKGAPDANRRWKDGERHAVLAEAPAHMLPALALMAFTGLGPGDVLRLPKTFYKDGAIAASRSKTGEPVYWPAPAPLRAILKNAPNHDAITLCANSSGEPWTVCGFRASWRKIRLKLEAERRINSGLTLYGLRHTVAVILRECGYDERTVADALGQKTIEMARLYARGANLTKKMSGVAKTLGREMNRHRTKVSNLSRNVSNRKASADGRSSKHQSNSWDSGGRTRTRTLEPLIKSLMSRAKVPFDIAERCVGHARGEMDATYNMYAHLDEKREAFEVLANLIAHIVDDRTRGRITYRQPRAKPNLRVAA
jgi:hypothetical protein